MMVSNGPRTKDKTSRDGKITVSFAMTEGRMSHWIFHPRVTVAGCGEPLLDLWPSEFWAWDGKATFPRQGSVHLKFRKYPGADPGFEVEIDTKAHTYRTIEGILHPDLVQAFGQYLTPATVG
jgi:hypothetical protein